MDFFLPKFTIPEVESPSIYDEGEHPSELLKSIDNKLDNQDTIIENQKIQITQLIQQNKKIQEQIEFAKKEAKSSKLESNIAIGISVVAIIIEILLNLFYK